jgi:PLP dependent protein
MADLLYENIKSVRERIQNAAQRAGRELESITLIAVTKTVTPALINAAYNYDIINMGENKVQEMTEKRKSTKDGIKWHFIGRLQTNKVKYIIGNLSLIHSLDRLELAREIQIQSKRKDVITPVLVQVNIAGEDTKGGLERSEVREFLNQVSEMSNISVRGLMTIQPASERQDDTRRWFKLMKDLKDEMADRKLPNINLEHLSMGMSGDFEVAIEEGATMVRIGTAIFGKR